MIPSIVNPDTESVAAVCDGLQWWTRRGEGHVHLEGAVAIDSVDDVHFSVTALRGPEAVISLHLWNDPGQIVRQHTVDETTLATADLPDWAPTHIVRWNPTDHRFESWSRADGVARYERHTLSGREVDVEYGVSISRSNGPLLAIALAIPEQNLVVFDTSSGEARPVDILCSAVHQAIFHQPSGMIIVGTDRSLLAVSPESLSVAPLQGSVGVECVGATPAGARTVAAESGGAIGEYEVGPTGVIRTRTITQHLEPDPVVAIGVLPTTTVIISSKGGGKLAYRGVPVDGSP